jgi:hypothetical protein
MFFSISCIGTWPGPSIMTCTSFFHALRVRSPSVRSCEDSAELLLRRLDFQRSRVSSGHLNLCVPRPVLDGADVDAIPKEPGGKRAAKSFQIPLFAFVSGHAPMTSTAVQPGAARRTLQRPKEMGVRQISIGSKNKTGLRILLVSLASARFTRLGSDASADSVVFGANSRPAATAARSASRTEIW